MCHYSEDGLPCMIEIHRARLLDYYVINDEYSKIDLIIDIKILLRVSLFSPKDLFKIIFFKYNLFMHVSCKY